MEEARRNLETAGQLKVLDKLLRQVEICAAAAELAAAAEPFSFKATIRIPEKDRPILLAAIAAGASDLLTGDVTHFGPYFGKLIEGVMIIPPGDYKEHKRKKRKD